MLKDHSADFVGFIALTTVQTEPTLKHVVY